MNAMSTRAEELTSDYLLDRSDSIAAIASEIAETHKLDPEIARLGAEWGRDWWYYLKDTSETLDQDILLFARDMALDGLPVPRDTTENRPTFRVQYAAQEALITMAGNQGVEIRELLEGKGHRIVPDFERIDHVLGTLLTVYDQKLWPYNLDSTRVPQDSRHMPRRVEFSRTPEERTDEDSFKLALFWFHDCYYMRGVNDSNDMTINLAQLYEEHPELFDPHHSQHLEPTKVEKLLLDYHLPVQHKQISEFWVENAKRLVERYDGDPQKIFDDFGTYEELVRRTRNNFKGGGFLGFQKKMTSMLGYFYMANGLVPYQNIPLPVDFHVMRTSIETEMVRFPGFEGAIDFERVTDFLRKVFYDFADYHDISQLDLCDVVWLYSREACVQSPTNSQTIIGKRAGRKTVWSPAIARQEDASKKQLETYHDSCGSMCRLRDICQQNIPSGEYYVSRRIIYPNPKLHFDTPSQVLLHDPEDIAAAQQGMRPTKGHSIDKRNVYREEEKRKRHARLRGLAHPALIPLTIEQITIVESSVIKTDRMPNATLSGKSFAFTEGEVASALGEMPDDATLQALKPYLNFEP
ncbi:MAG TPA: hypothetical protein PKD68_01920 [Candidatus Saccharibacteria bacterium]|nr:hypothetical protein [Candidatus Saccharibacteria bacterium]